MHDFYIFNKELNNILTLSSGDKILKNECFTIIEHEQNRILYTVDDDDCILAYRIYELNELNTLEDKNKKVIQKFSNITEISAMGLLGTAVAAAIYLKR